MSVVLETFEPQFCRWSEIAQFLKSSSFMKDFIPTWLAAKQSNVEATDAAEQGNRAVAEILKKTDGRIPFKFLLGTKKK